jgi:hypothetical protein
MAYKYFCGHSKDFIQFGKCVESFITLDLFCGEVMLNLNPAPKLENHLFSAS